MAEKLDPQVEQFVTAIEARLGRKLYREERRIVRQGGNVISYAERISKAEARLARKLSRSERQSVLHGEDALLSAARGESWMARPHERVRGKVRVYRGGAVESNRRHH